MYKAGLLSTEVKDSSKDGYRKKSILRPCQSFEVYWKGCGDVENAQHVSGRTTERKSEGTKWRDFLKGITQD